MREYSFRAADETIEALRRLRRGWAHYRVADEALVVVLADGGHVVVRSESAEVESGLEARRIAATAADSADGEGDEANAEAARSDPGSLAAGANDVVVFRSETWVEAPGAASADGGDPDRTVQFSGSPLQRSPTAAAVCAVDDAFVVASGAGEGVLVRVGLKPGTVEVVTERGEIARFLAERQYQ